MIEIIILDDHMMVLRGLQAMLKDNDKVIVKKVFSRGSDLMEYLVDNSAHVLLLDINLPDNNGIDLCKSISKMYPRLKVIGLSNYSDSSFVKSMMRSGAKGYLLKNTSKDELIEACQTVVNDELYLSKVLKNNLLNESFGERKSSFIPILTRREKEILECIGNELTNNEIAKLLFISTKTVESHRNNLLQKFGVRNTAGLIKAAIVKGLLS